MHLGTQLDGLEIGLELWKEGSGLNTSHTRPRITRISSHLKQGQLKGLYAPFENENLTSKFQVTQGSAVLIFVDMQSSSPTYLEWQGLELSAEAGLSVLLSGKYAWGVCVAENRTELLRQYSHKVAPESLLIPLEGSPLSVDLEEKVTQKIKVLSKLAA